VRAAAMTRICEGAGGPLITAIDRTDWSRDWASRARLALCTLP
jgi:hypothetical protein